MRLLIDGYNLMHALGLLGRTLGPDGLRKVRHRFLNDLGAALDPLLAHQTTVVFDAAQPPKNLPKQASQKGMTIVYAVDDEDADARIEDMIRVHSSPKNLTVVSSDRRIREAAQRRRAKSISADDFWTGLQSRRSAARSASRDLPTAEDRAKRDGATAPESAYWMAEFGHLDDEPETRAAFAPADFVPTDEQIARIEREVAEEP